MQVCYPIFFAYAVLAFSSGCNENGTPAYDVDSSDKGTEQLVNECEKCIILSEQSEPQVAIVDVEKRKILWSWEPFSADINSEHAEWFNNISDAKIVYDGRYIITCASGGGVALIRIKDKKTLFYAYAGGNTHSVEILPDGNLVSASSTGDFLTLFKVDTVSFPENVYSKQIPVEFGHNVVWDKQNQVLWSAAGSELISFEYNFNCEAPDLTILEKIALPGVDAHDLFPVYGENSLWLTNTTDILKFDIATKEISLMDTPIHEHIKSISSGPSGLPTIIIKPKVSWWTDEVVDLQGNTVYYENGLKIYKARWLVNNAFSYPEADRMRVCEE